MNLSIAVITAGKPFARATLEQMRAWANLLDADLVVAGDREAGYALAREYADTALAVQVQNGLGESVVPELARACAHEWVLRFDDDETGTWAMFEWLKRGEWNTVAWDAFNFPRGHLWGDTEHFITDAPLWEDRQTRLVRREITERWHNQVHAGSPAGRSADVPAMMLHHKFLVRTYEERQETARLYDSLRAGAGTDDHFGRFTLPELFFLDGVHVREVGTGAADLNQWTGTGELVECSRKTGRDSTAIGKGGWNPALGNLYAG